VHEADRLGLLGILHPQTALGWLGAVVACLAFMPGGWFRLWDNSGATMLVFLLPLLLIYQRMNTRHAFELALFDWLRLG
jgi:hypothetical protein